MASAIACRPPDDPSLIRVYHLTSADHAISNIALSRMKVSRFSDLNDPFELLALNVREASTRKVVRSFKDTYDTHTGLLCFSADWKQPVLWSHYAAKHHGVCLGFDVPRGDLQKVSYKADRVLAQLGDDPDPRRIDQKLQDLLLCTKSKGWEYEEESRRFVPLSDALQEGRLHFMPLGPSLQLTEVVLGALCQLDVRSVRELVTSKYPNAVTYRSRLAIKSFNVVPEESTVP